MYQLDNKNIRDEPGDYSRERVFFVSVQAGTTGNDSRPKRSRYR